MKKIFEKIQNFFTKLVKWVRVDGLLHIETCALLCVMLRWLQHLWLIAFIVFVIGILKGVYDKFSDKGTAEWHDLFCNIIGIALGILLIV